MTPTETAAAVGAGGVVIGAVIAAASSWWATSLTARQARKAQRAARREAAYTEFILCAETLHRVMTDWGTVPGTQPADTIGHHVGHAAGSVYRTYIAVMLTGSEQAAGAGVDVYRKAWDIRRWFTRTVTTLPLSQELGQDLEGQVAEYVALLRRFAAIARTEITGETSRAWWRLGLAHRRDRRPLDEASDLGDNEVTEAKPPA